MLLPLAQSLAQHKALMLGVGLTSAKTALADIATQTVVEHRGLHELDVRRIGIFAFCAQRAPARRLALSASPSAKSG